MALYKLVKPVAVGLGVVVLCDAADALGYVSHSLMYFAAEPAQRETHLPENGRTPGPPWTTQGVSRISSGSVERPAWLLRDDGPGIVLWQRGSDYD